MQIVVKINSENINIDVDGNQSVLNIKQKLNEHNTEYKVENMRLIFMGKILKDDQSIDENGMKGNSTIHCVISQPQNTNQNNSSNQQNNSSNEQEAPMENPWAQTETNTQSQTASNPFATMMQSFGGGQGMGQGMNTQGMGMGQGMNIQGMQQMMSSPSFQNIMSSLMSNPQNLQKMMDVNRRLQSGELNYMTLMNDPMYREVCSDPNFSQGLQQFMSDPNSRNMMSSMMSSTGGSNTNTDQNMNTSQNVNTEQELLTNSQLSSLPIGETNTEENKEKYKEQLEQLRNFGFTNEEENLKLLVACQGNTEIVMNRLLDLENS